MERRLLLVFVLTFVVILLFQPVLKKYIPQPPEQKPDRADKDGLSRPGLTCKDREPALEFNAHVLDERQVLHGRFAEHETRRPGDSGRPNGQR